MSVLLDPVLLDPVHLEPVLFDRKRQGIGGYHTKWRGIKSRSVSRNPQA